MFNFQSFAGAILESIDIHEFVSKSSGWAFLNSKIGKVVIHDIAAWCNIDFPGISSNPLNNADHLYLDDVEITDLAIPDMVTKIKSNTFSLCEMLTSVTIPSSVMEIGYDAFRKCSGLTRVNIQDLGAWCNIDFENEYANPLRDAKRLYLDDVEIIDLVIPNTVTKINPYAFCNGGNITSAYIPNSVTSIGAFSFQNCENLTNVTIPNSVVSIGENAFYGCGLNSIVIPESVISIGSGAFDDCPNLTEIVYFGQNDNNTTAELPSNSNATIYCYKDICSNSTNFEDLVAPVDEEAAETMWKGAALSRSSEAMLIRENPGLYGGHSVTEVTVVDGDGTAVSKGDDGCYRVTTNTASVSYLFDGYPVSYEIKADDRVSTGVDSVSDDGGVSVAVEDGAVVVNGSADQVVVYSASGVCVYRGKGSRIGGLAKGIYIVRVGDRPFKVAI